MKLIKDLGTKRTRSGKLERLGLFYCEYCENEVEKAYHHGKHDKSCGCYKNAFISDFFIKHGDNRKNNPERLYNTWAAMKQRCNNANHQAYKDYGGRGIKVCKQWEKSYVVFKIWALLHGYKDRLTIERTDNNKGYEPLNCQWITKGEQSKNKRSNKLSIKKAQQIRNLYFNVKIEQELLSKIFNVTKPHIRRIINNTVWVK